ncbi:MAG TPA: sugar phosphate nucleotidyltransferase [Chthoniobacterales bacterium]|jgi:1L-myo-inositol 1-phosphate cytidylyltransferase|nr:sugar phosphate nucleotidyltransferase [Chthoniobacterales bacterium]
MRQSGSTSKKSVTDAVILMAGSGSRLRAIGNTLPKPLIQIAGRPVFSYTIESLPKGGIETVYIVTGSNSEVLLAGLKASVPAGVRLHPIHNSDWQKQNGISVLAVAEHLRSPFLLMMGDHLFDPAIVDLAIHNADPNALNVAVDRKINAIFDLTDAMKVKTKGDRVVAIGKDLQDYDAIDTGVFVCPPEIFKYLERAKRDGDCSLADGVRAMAADGKVRAIDIGDAWWQDIDTPEMLAQAERAMRNLNEGGSTIGTRDTAVS